MIFSSKSCVQAEDPADRIRVLEHKLGLAKMGLEAIYESLQTLRSIPMLAAVISPIINMAERTLRELAIPEPISNDMTSIDSYR